MVSSLESFEAHEAVRKSPHSSLQVDGAREGVRGAMRALVGTRMPEIEIKPLSGKPLTTIDLQSKPLRGKPLPSIDLQSKGLRGKPLATIDLQSKPLRSKPLRTESLEKDVTIITRSLTDWSSKASQGYLSFSSPDALKTAYLQAYPHYAPFFKVLATELSRVCVVIHKSMLDLEKKAVADFMLRAMTWHKDILFDPSHITTSTDLRNEYLKHSHADKKRYEASKQKLDPFFEQQYKNLNQAHQGTIVALKKVIADRSASLLKPSDIEDESLRDPQKFSSAMMKRFDSLFQQHAKPESRLKELEGYALSLIRLLHNVWQQKNKVHSSTEAKAEMSILEATIALWRPNSKQQPQRYEEFLQQFLAQSPHKELLRMHKAFADNLLRLSWQRFSLERSAAAVEGTSAEEAVKEHAHVSRAKVANLSPALEVALRSKNAMVDMRLQQKFSSVDWDDIMPSLATIVGQDRLRAGGDRIRRLGESQKMDALFSDRQDKLTPFILALCSFFDDETEVQRSMRELERSKSPKDSIRIILASEASRRAAMKVRQIPKVWDKFESSLMSIGVSLKDLHLHVEDEDEESDAVDTEILLGMEQGVEDAEAKQASASEERNDVHGDFDEQGQQESEINELTSITRIREVLQKRVMMREGEYAVTSMSEIADDVDDMALSTVGDTEESQDGIQSAQLAA